MVVRELRGRFKFSLLLEIAGISKQEYYYVINHEFDKDNKDKIYEELILKIFNKNYQKYGSPRITEALNIKLNKLNMKKINHKRVERLIHKLNIQARPKQRKYVSYKGKIGKIAPNVLNRDFSTDFPFQKLGTDVTVFIMPFGKLYLFPIIDFCTREILSYDLSEHPDFRQIIKMLKMLKDRHGKNISNAILHSDQGWQYQIERYREKIKELNIIQSMSRKGNCLDNSPTENFFGRMKEEMFYGKESQYKNVMELFTAIVQYIEYYNNERIVARLHMSPIQYRKLNYGLI